MHWAFVTCLETYLEVIDALPPPILISEYFGLSSLVCFRQVAFAFELWKHRSSRKVTQKSPAFASHNPSFLKIGCSMEN
jgi:hypothetical protein